MIQKAPPAENWKRPSGSRAPPYHVAEHHPARSDISQLHTDRSSRCGSELSSGKTDAYVWRYALLVVHARKEGEEAHSIVLTDLNSYVTCNRPLGKCHVTIIKTTNVQEHVTEHSLTA